jgi:hypothetical protein
MSPGRPQRKQGGLTLVEIAMAVALLLVLLLSVQHAVLRGVEEYRGVRLTAQVEDELRRAIHRIATEMLGLERDLLDPNPDGDFGTDTLVFQTIIGVGGGVPIPGPRTRLAFEYAEGELDDGLDNNDDGSVDEGLVTLTRSVGLPDEKRTVLVRGVREFLQGEIGDGDDDNGNGVIDERGFNVHRSGDTLRVRLTLEEVDRQGQPITRTIETSVHLRN